MRASPEEHLHVYVADLLRLKARPSVIHYHPPNGEFRSKRTGARLKRMGVRAGVADFALILPCGMAAFLELKSAKGVPSDAQRAFRADCERNGTPYAIARTPNEAYHILLAWGAIEE